MSQNFKDFLYQLFLLGVLTLVTNIAKEYWLSISKPEEKTISQEIDLKKIRSQFSFALMLLIVSIIAFANSETQFVQGTSVVLIVLAIILLWGAFDAVYFSLEKLKCKSPQIVPDETTEDPD